MSDVKTLDVINKKESADLVKGVVEFDTNIELPSGVHGFLFPNSDNYDKTIMNPYYEGGELKLRMKIVGAAPKRFEIGDKIATLVLLG